MTSKLYRKVLAGTLLASTVLVASVASNAKANPIAPTSDMTGGMAASMTGRDLLSGQASAHQLAPVAVNTMMLSRPDVGGSVSRLIAGSVDVAQSPTRDTFAPLSDEDIRRQLLIDPGDTIDFSRPSPVPSSSFLTPSAYGADWGDAYIGLAGSTGGNNADRLDGSASLGFGLGNSVRNVGLEVGVSIISLDGFADDGVVGFKLHKSFPQANNLAIALGWSNPIKWGAANQAEDTFYGVATQRFNLRPSAANRLPLTVSLGLGTGSFRSTGAIAADDNDVNVFGSAALRVIPEVSVISSWNGTGLGLAASAAPFDFPAVLTLGVSDVTGNTSDGAQFQGSLGYSFNF